jgi:WS/DGAT C-terminal domain
MVRWYPYVPVGGEMAVNCAILSYDGTVYFGFSGDVHAAPDLRRLEEFLKLSFEEMQEACGVKTQGKRKKSGRTNRAKKAETGPVLTAPPAFPAQAMQSENETKNVAAQMIA